MQISVTYNGKVSDIKYKKRTVDTIIKLDEITIGQIFFNEARKSYSVVVNGSLSIPAMRSDSGF